MARDVAALPAVTVVEISEVGHTQHLINGVVNSPDVTEIRNTSPHGISVVVPTGPANPAISSRFVLNHLDLEVSNGIRLDQFTIEDA